MKRFARVLSEAQDRLKIPEPARTRILLEMASDLEDSFEFWVGKHVSEVEAALGKPRKRKAGSPYSTVVWRFEVTCAAIHGPHRVEIRWGDQDVYGAGSDVYVIPVQSSIFGHTLGERQRVAYKVDAQGYVRGFEARRTKKRSCPEYEP